MLTVSVFMAWQGKTPLRARLTKSNVIISAKLIYPAQLNVGPGHGWDAVCMGVHGDGDAWRIFKIEIISPVVPLLSAVPRPWHNINFYRLGCVLGVMFGLDSAMKVFILR